MPPTGMRLGLRLTRAQVEALGERAREAGLGVSEWARRVLFREAGLPEESARIGRSGWPKGRRRRCDAGHLIHQRQPDCPSCNALFAAPGVPSGASGPADGPSAA